jgi:hypothetical protein
LFLGLPKLLQAQETSFRGLGPRDQNQQYFKKPEGRNQSIISFHIHQIYIKKKFVFGGHKLATVKVTTQMQSVLVAADAISCIMLAYCVPKLQKDDVEETTITGLLYVILNLAVWNTELIGHHLVRS